jgi:hypothetical protein
MKKLLVGMAVVFSLSLIAQDEPVVNFNSRMMMGEFNIGYGNWDISKMQAFVPDNVAKMRNDQLLIGLSTRMFLNKFVVGASLSAVSGGTTKTTTLRITQNGGLASIDFGYLILSNDKIKIYPLVGLGAGGYGLTIMESVTLTPGDIMNEPGREINLKLNQFVLDGSVNLNVIPLVRFREKRDFYTGLVTGIKVGYLLGFPSSDWKYSGGDIVNGPSMGMNMLYFKVVLGRIMYRNKT